jgi:hypothetical protein
MEVGKPQLAMGFTLDRHFGPVGSVLPVLRLPKHHVLVAWGDISAGQLSEMLISTFSAVFPPTR